eukprot:8648177-Pyramimonas_sp.AAC.1
MFTVTAGERQSFRNRFAARKQSMLISTVAARRNCQPRPPARAPRPPTSPRRVRARHPRPSVGVSDTPRNTWGVLPLCAGLDCGFCS